MTQIAEPILFNPRPLPPAGSDRRKFWRRRRAGPFASLQRAFPTAGVSEIAWPIVSLRVRSWVAGSDQAVIICAGSTRSGTSSALLVSIHDLAQKHGSFLPHLR